MKSVPSRVAAKLLREVTVGLMATLGATMMINLSSANGAVIAKALPSAVTNWSRVSQFGVYGNRFLNDCSLAALAELEQAQNASVGRSAAPLVTGDLETEYWNLTGGSDSGATPAQVFQAAQRGFAGIKIDSATSTGTGRGSVERAVWQLGGLFVTLEVTAAEFDHASGVQSVLSAKTPAWTSSGASSSITPVLHLHAAAVVGYDRSYVYLATWGTVQRVTWSWWKERVRQAWAIVPASFVTLGHGPHEPVSALGEEFS